MYNMTKLANGFRGSRIPKGTLLFLVVVNLVLGIKLASTHLELKHLREEQQNSLHENFPPLTRTQVSSFLTQLFPGFGAFEHTTFGNTIKYRIFDQTKLLGIAYQVREDIQCPACKDVRFFIGVDVDNTITGIVLVNKFHLYGEPLATEIVDEFLGQFIKKHVNYGFQFDTNVQGITGATKTAEHFLDGILGVKSLHMK